MTNKEFFKELTHKLPMYSLFNNLRETMFSTLAEEPRHPMDKDGVLKKINDAYGRGIFSQKQLELIGEMVGADDNIRAYFVNVNTLGVVYIVNMTATETDKDHVIASHIHYTIPDDVAETLGESNLSSMSVIVLLEKHSELRPVQYPKVIKHELCHAVMEHIVKDYPDLMDYYFDEKSSNFVELICDVVPYISLPVKKENGLEKFMEDAHVIFGYNEEDPGLLEMLQDIHEAQDELEQAIPDEETSTDE